MQRPKQKKSRKDAASGLILTVLSSPLVGFAIVYATVGLLLSMMLAAHTGLDIFFVVIAMYGALLVTLYLILLRMLRRARALFQYMRAIRQESERTAHLSERMQQARTRLQMLETATCPAVQPATSQQQQQR